MQRLVSRTLRRPRTPPAAAAAPTAPRRTVVTKTSTGLVGLPVDVNGRANFIAACEEVLANVRAAIPEDAQYRVDTEALYGYRMGVAQGSTDELHIEAEIGQGQLEELIQVANDELKLADKYAEWRMWEGLPTAVATASDELGDVSMEAEAPAAQEAKSA